MGRDKQSLKHMNREDKYQMFSIQMLLSQEAPV